MVLSSGRDYLAIPGPSVIPDRVLQAMHRPSPNIYDGELIEITASVLDDLKFVAGTKHHAAIYIANGHGVWEAALSNIVGAGDQVLVPSVGAFGQGWAEMAAAIGAKAEVMEFGHLKPMDIEAVRARLEADTDHTIKAVLFTHVDTSTSMKTDPRVLRAILDDLNHPALLCADCIASLGCDQFKMDAWGVDVMVAASQKGMMVPAGVGFVFFNDRAFEQSQQVTASGYWDWGPRINPEIFYHHFAGTAPTHHMFGLRTALDMIKEEGLEAIWYRHEVLAKTIWAAADVWGKGGAMTLNVSDPVNRSFAVTAAHLGQPFAKDLRAWLEANTGVTLGIGLGMSTADDPKGEGFFRFGHMGHVNAHMVLGMLASVEAGMLALDIPHGAGALSEAARVVADGARTSAVRA